MKFRTLVIALLLSQASYAQTPKEFANVYTSFTNGAYVEVIEGLKRIKENSQTRGLKFYLLGVSYARLQEFDKAAYYLAFALKAGNKAEDLYYELGQALYAKNDLEKSRKAFYRAAKGNYKRSTSLYYIAHISQILEEHKRAKSFYEQVLNDKDTSKELSQVSRFQLAEVMMEMARQKEETARIVESYILPQYRLVLKIDDKSTVAQDAERRIKEIEKEFGLDPNLMVNGRTIPAKRHRLSFSQSFEYDNNITLVTDTPDVSSTQKDSFLFNTTVQTGYKFVFKRRYQLEPTVDFYYLKHQDQDDAEIYTNDYYQLTPKLKTKFEHKLFNAPASFLVDFEYEYKKRDVEANHQLTLNNRTTTFVFGERFKYFSIGETTLKFKLKSFRSYLESNHFDAKIISLDQIAFLSNGDLIIGLWQYDSNDYFNNVENSTSTNLFRIDYIRPNFMFKTTLNLALSLTMTTYDDATRSTERGTEKTWNPYFKLSRSLSDKMTINFSYSYTKNSSLQSSQQYTKHITATEINYDF